MMKLSLGGEVQAKIFQTTLSIGNLGLPRDWIEFRGPEILKCQWKPFKK